MVQKQNLKARNLPSPRCNEEPREVAGKWGWQNYGVSVLEKVRNTDTKITKENVGKRSVEKYSKKTGM